jgi:hypothetical protein
LLLFSLIRATRLFFSIWTSYLILFFFLQELKKKLQEVYGEIKLDEVKDEVKDEENKYLGLNKYWYQMRGVTAASDVQRNALKSKNADGSERFPYFFNGEASEGPKGNFGQRRMATKVKKVRKPKISNSNP